MAFDVFIIDTTNNNHDIFPSFNMESLRNCLVANDKLGEAHDQFLEGISVLVMRSTYSFVTFKSLSTSLDNLINDIVIGKDFRIEFAVLLCHTCWYANGSRNLNHLNIPMVVSTLKQCFLLCCEVHRLF